MPDGSPVTVVTADDTGGGSWRGSGRFGSGTFTAGGDGRGGTGAPAFAGAGSCGAKLVRGGAEASGSATLDEPPSPAAGRLPAAGLVTWRPGASTCTFLTLAAARCVWAAR